MKSADLALLVQFGAAFFDAPYQHHLVIKLKFLLPIHAAPSIALHNTAPAGRLC